MMAILTEHLNGKWPLWISPRQVAFCTVNNQAAQYAHEVARCVCVCVCVDWKCE
jgi:threonyl-tRNA synthetase